MKTDNNTGKNKNFFARAKEKFDAIPPFARPVRMSKDEIQSGGSRRMTEQPTSAEYAQGYAEGFNDACRPVQEPVESYDCVTRESAENAIECIANYCTKGRDLDAQAMLVTASPPKRQPLTEQQLHALFDSPLTPTGIQFARTIEQAHGIGDKT